MYAGIFRVQVVGPSIYDGMTQEISPGRDQFHWLIRLYSSAFFLIGSCLIAGMVISIWVISSWEYLPEWAPVPGPELMTTVSCFRPIILFLCGVPTAFAFIVGVTANLSLLLKRTSARNILSSTGFLLGLIILFCSPLPLVYQDKIEDGLKRYAAARYDVTIDAIEKYHAETGQYPPTLQALVPQYLPTVPGIYMKFGEALLYYPDAKTAPGGYVGIGPFIFEVTGLYAGVNGQTLKYCPVSEQSCSGFRGRLNDRWVWAYDAIL